MRSYSDLLLIRPTFPRKSVIMLVLLKFALLGALIFFAWDSYHELGLSRKCLRLSELVGIIDNLDEVLSMSAKMAAATGDKSWEDRYRNFEPKLNCAIKEALQVGKELCMANAVTRTDAANVNIVSIEHQAFELIHAGRNKAASALLNSPEYESEKNVYRNGMEKITEQINDFVNRKEDDNYFKNCMLVAFVLLVVPALIISMIVIFVMIKRYEHELNRCENRFRDFSEISNNWIWELDSKMHFTFSNGNVKRLLGFSPEEVLGKTPDELMPQSEHADIRRLMEDLMNSPKRFNDPSRKILHKDGSAKTLHVNGIPLYNHNDEFMGFRGICMDIT